MAHRIYESKQEVREAIELRTDPETPLLEQADTIMSSALLGGLLGVRNGLKILKHYTTDNDEFPTEEHKLKTQRVMSGMGERMTAFELELMNVLVDLIWEINNCECDWCIQKAAEREIDEMRRNASNN